MRCSHCGMIVRHSLCQTVGVPFGNWAKQAETTRGTGPWTPPDPKSCGPHGPRLKKKKTKRTAQSAPYDTRGSHMVPHCGTGRAQQRLTSQFGRDAVQSLWCDRKTAAVHFCPKSAAPSMPSAKSKNDGRPYDTQASRMVPHYSTGWAQQCLTSQFGWDAV